MTSSIRISAFWVYNCISQKKLQLVNSLDISWRASLGLLGVKRFLRRWRKCFSACDSVSFERQERALIFIFNS